MQLKEILSIEENRTEDSRGVIHLFQEGTFYRAYKWSAWLCHRYVHQFKVTHKLFRNIESSVLFVGFPVNSLPKYVQEGTSVFDVDEKCKDLVLAYDVIPEGMTVDVMKTDYEAWKASVQELIGEVSVVGGVLIAAAGLGVMGIKDCKTINLLPALLMPMVFFALKDLLALI